jgi:hypothetical protein
VDRRVAPLAALLCLLGGTSALAQGSRVEPGLRWLVGQQGQDGSWGKHDKLALTGMSGMALLASGSTPERGPYSGAISRAIEFVIASQRADGRAFTHASSGYSAIHNHGYALLFLTQCYGEGGPLDERLSAAIRLGIRATIGSQFDNGGFGYFLYRTQVPRAHQQMWRDDEASTTISQLQALRGARNAGFTVDRRALERAAEYIARCQHGPTGGFVYSIGSPRVSFEEGSDRPTFAITAASTAVLHALGTYRGESLQRGLDYMEPWLPPTKKRIHFFYYAHYYAAQVWHMVGGERGRRWLEAIDAELAKRQHPDGYWGADGEDSLDASDSAVLNTAWALQISQIERELLPIHQR